MALLRGLQAAGIGESPWIESELRDAYYQKQRSIGDGFSLLDFFYVAAIYLFAFIGVLFGRNTHSLDLLLILIILGWAAVHLLIEVQTRYRFLAMPLLCIFAGRGIRYTGSVLSFLTNRKKSMTGPLPSAGSFRTGSAALCKAPCIRDSFSRQILPYGPDQPV